MTARPVATHVAPAHRFPVAARALLGGALLLAALAAAAHPAPELPHGTLLAAYTVDAGRGANLANGARLHRLLAEAHEGATGATVAVPNGEAGRASQGRRGPLAPAARGLSDAWFAAECPRALQRACSAAERADVMAWLLATRGAAGETVSQAGPDASAVRVD